MGRSNRTQIIQPPASHLHSVCNNEYLLCVSGLVNKSFPLFLFAESAMVLSPLPPLTVSHPGDNITVAFRFRGFPDPQVQWMLGDISLQKQRIKFRPHLQPLVASNNSMQAELAIIGLDEQNTGVLTPFSHSSILAKHELGNFFFEIHFVIAYSAKKGLELCPYSCIVR